MGEVKYLNKVLELFRKSPVVSISSLKKVVKGDYVNLLIANLLTRGKIKRLAKGCYSIYEDPSLAVFCFKPAYLGLQDALSLHNLWEQETIPVIITTRKVRQGARKILRQNVLIRRINQKYFFGVKLMKCGDFYFPVSDIEKTLIDMVYFVQEMDRELLTSIKKRINEETLKSYLKRYSNRFRNKVLKTCSLIED